MQSYLPNPTQQPIRQLHKMRTAFLLCSLLPLCQGYSKTTWRDLQANAQYSYAAYLTEFGKAPYPMQEYLRRKVVFEANLAAIRAHNADETQSWKMGLNEFSDWTKEEVVSKRTGHNARGANVQGAGVHAVPTTPLAETAVDWREKHGIVSEVKNQGACGSCWAFSAAAALESAGAIATGKLHDLSEQQYVSCAPNPKQCGGAGGCDGSTQPLAFNYSVTNGLVAQERYPYTAKTGSCETLKTKPPVVGHTGFVALEKNHYGSLMHAVTTIGPIAISVAASEWSLYEEGVYNNAKCGYVMNHAVVLVGYGNDEASGHDYWIVRNSWGASWGEKGYIRIARFGDGKEPCGMDEEPEDGDACKGETTPIKYCGLCAILSSSSYPTGAFNY